MSPSIYRTFSDIRCLALITLLGCSSAASEDDASDDALVTGRVSDAEAHACAEGKVVTDPNGDSVVRCTKPFAEAPTVHLPADTDGATFKFYGGVTLPLNLDGAFVLWSRDGARYVPVGANGKALDFAGGSLPRGLHAPTNRVTFTLYQFTGKVGGSIDSAYGAAKKITLSAARPVVELDGCAFDSRLAGAWEGDVSERLTTPPTSPFSKAFDDSKRVPIRVKLTGLEASRDLADFANGGRSLTDQKTYILTGKIENFDRNIVDGDKTFPSLEGMGKKNPFAGASNGKVSLYRVGNMHGLHNDGHWVFTYPEGSSNLTTNGMTGPIAAFTAPTLLFEPDVTVDALSSLSVLPHIPQISNGQRVELHPVDVGAQTGECPR
jgi:hypothetical protein